MAAGQNWQQGSAELAARLGGVFGAIFFGLERGGAQQHGCPQQRVGEAR